MVSVKVTVVFSFDFTFFYNALPAFYRQIKYTVTVDNKLNQKAAANGGCFIISLNEEKPFLSLLLPLLLFDRSLK